MGEYKNVTDQLLIFGHIALLPGNTVAARDLTEKETEAAERFIASGLLCTVNTAVEEKVDTVEPEDVSAGASQDVEQPVEEEQPSKKRRKKA